MELAEPGINEENYIAILCLDWHGKITGCRPHHFTSPWNETGIGRESQRDKWEGSLVAFRGFGLMMLGECYPRLQECSTCQDNEKHKDSSHKTRVYSCGVVYCMFPIPGPAHSRKVDRRSQWSSIFPRCLSFSQGVFHFPKGSSIFPRGPQF